MHKRLFFAFALLSAAATSAAAQEAWPSRPIKLVLPQAAGSAPDTTARLLGTLLGPRLGQPVVVENRQGAGGSIAAEYVARSAPDGYTFFLATSAPLVLNLFLTKNLRYDPVGDFTGVAKLSASAFVLVANRKLPINSVAELMAADKAAPGTLHFASEGVKSLGGLTGEMFNRTAGTKLVQVSYSQTGRAVVDTVGGQTQFSFQSEGVVLDFIRRGELKALGTTSTGSPNLPGVPSLSETLPGFDVVGWSVLVAPKGTPKAVIDKMNANIDQVMRQPEWIEPQKKMNGGLVKTPGTPAELNAFLDGERSRWGALIKSLGIQPE